ncbi:MAG TPA: Crp/Fnr family transcriptional regulator [Pseudolabrys sp.]|jgi:CRP-like cAMP-binding protein|nr:Crp/Fnr family transcriptional regulator [Pseudolabrys sp.]
MPLEDDIALFERVPTFAPLGKQALRILAIGAETRELQPGVVLFYSGDVAESGYVVADGSLHLEPGAPLDGRETIVGPGALIGEQALITEAVRPATATALEPTTVIRISRTLFLRMLEGYPAAARKLRDSMANRTEQLTRDLGRVVTALGGERER